jgi:hypothetical protein
VGYRRRRGATPQIRRLLSLTVVTALVTGPGSYKGASALYLVISRGAGLTCSHSWHTRPFCRSAPLQSPKPSPG